MAGTVIFINLRSTPHEGRRALFAARRLGLDVVLLADRVPAFANGELAGLEIVDTYDLEPAVAAAGRLADRFSPRGVVTWGDRDVELVSLVAERLGLPAPSPAAARLTRDKFAMREALAPLGDLVPPHALVRTWEDLRAGIRSVGFPAVLKPTGSSGSTGIFELHGHEDLRPAYEHLQAIAAKGRSGAAFVLEAFLDGPEFSVEGWVHDGRVFVAGITDKWTTEPYHLEYQHIHPSGLPPAKAALIARSSELVVRTLGLDHCAFHLECKLGAGGYRVVEVAARIGGDYITSHLIPLSTGIDFYGDTIRVATGQAPCPEPRESLHAGVRFLLARSEGRLVGLRDVDAMLRTPEVEHLIVEQAPGETIVLPPLEFSRQRVAAVIARHPDYALVLQALSRAGRHHPVLTASPSAA
jgi:biotin carboxylase